MMATFGTILIEQFRTIQDLHAIKNTERLKTTNKENYLTNTVA